MRFFYPCAGGWILAASFILVSSGAAQKQVTAQEVQASPAKFNGQKVFVYVQLVEFPALHINRERGYSEFMVVTADDGSSGGGNGLGAIGRGPRRATGDYAGHIIVRVPAGEVERFSDIHAIKAGQGSSGKRKKISATFRATSSGRGGYLDLTDGSSADLDPFSPENGPRPRHKPPGSWREEGENQETNDQSPTR